MNETSRLRGHIIAMVDRISEPHILKRRDSFVSLWYVKAPTKRPQERGVPLTANKKNQLTQTTSADSVGRSDS